MKYLGFDLEVTRWPEDGNWDKKTPLGVSCIGLMGTGWNEPEVYYASSLTGNPEPRAMRTDELKCFADDLFLLAQNYTVVSWNGLQFDFSVLNLEKHNDIFPHLAMNHIDPMFYILCHKGWPVGLDTVAKGLGLSGKTEGMSGAQAPEMWMDGTLEDRQKVLEYVGQDAITTLDIVEVASRTKMLKWRSKSGRPQSLPFEPLTTTECLEIPVPDTSWMTNPLTRASFYDWTNSNAE